MIGSFACPHCGTRVAPRGDVPARHVRCIGCGTLLEVPLFPRTTTRPRSSHRKMGWMIAGGGVLVAIVMVVISVSVARSRGNSSRMAEMTLHHKAAEAAEARGDVVEALRELDLAVGIAGRLPSGSEVKRARVARDRMARLALESQIKNAEDTEDPVATLRSLRDQAEADPALHAARDAVDLAIAESVERHAKIDLASAGTALAAGDAARALMLCERVAKSVETVGAAGKSPLMDEADAIVRQVVARLGVRFAPITGEFLDGPSASLTYAANLQPAVADALRTRGFLPKPSHTAFASVWDTASGSVFGIVVNERHGDNFLQTPILTSQISLGMSLTRGGNVVWQASAQGRTRVPPPFMTTFESTRISLVKTRDPVMEKTLYDDARKVLAENAAKSLRNLPTP